MEAAIGIDFGGTTIKSGLVAGGNVVKRGTVVDTQKAGGLEDLLASLVGIVEELRGEGVAGVGVGLPGMVDANRGVVNQLTNVAGWNAVPLRKILEQRTGLPVAIENDANAMAYGEWRHGAARDGRHVICITLGTGVGGALILDGHLYRGATMGAGEVGHMSIDYHGLPGHYGNPGALEKYVGNQQITDRAFSRYAEKGLGRSREQCTPAALSEAARAGDQIALGLWEEVGYEIGVALSSAIWLVNPDTVVIGGGVAKAGELVFGPIRRTIRSQTGRVFHEHLRIVEAQLGNDAGIIGNAALALEAAREAGRAGAV
jgi:glucokinase